MKPIKQWNFAEIIPFVKSVDKRTWLAVFAGAFGFLLVVVFLVIPAWIQRPLLRRDIQNMQEQIRLFGVLNEKRPALEAKKKVFGPLIEETQKRVFTIADMGLLLGHISKMAGESSVDVLASKPLDEKAVFPAPYDSKYQPSGYEIAVQGGYHEVAGLASRIESHEKLLRIQSLEIAPDPKAPDRHIAVLRLWVIIKGSPQAVTSAKAKKAAKAKNAKK